MSFGFPELDASLNATSGLLLCAGYGFVKRRKWRAHGWTMVLATVVSAIFLVFYLTYHYQHGERSTRGHGAHWLRLTYLSVLIPHLILAVGMLPMIFLTLLRAYRRDWEAHRRLARRTIVVWLFVSVTGVIVYFMLYHTALAT